MKRCFFILTALLVAGCASRAAIPKPSPITPAVFQKTVTGGFVPNQVGLFVTALLSDVPNHKILAAAFIHNQPYLVKIAMNQRVTKHRTTIGARSLALGSDQNIWALGNDSAGNNLLARITPSHVETDFQVPQGLTDGKIVSGPDGALWFPECSPDGQSGAIARVDTQGNFTADPGSCASALTIGSDENIWFSGGPNIYVMTTAGQVIAQYPLGFTRIESMLAGPDGNVYASGCHTIGCSLVSVSPQGIVTFQGDLDFRTAMAVGPDGNMWFVDGNKIFPFNFANRSFGHFIHCVGCHLENSIAAGPDNNVWLGSRSGTETYLLRTMTASPNDFSVKVGKSVDVTVSETNYSGTWTASTPNPPLVSLNPSSQNGQFHITGLAPGNTTVVIVDSMYNSIPVNVTVTQ
jgi:streptogramin lyase